MATYTVVSSRGSKEAPTYRIRYAESADINWSRTINDVVLDVSCSGWDSGNGPLSFCLIIMVSDICFIMETVMENLDSNGSLRRLVFSMISSRLFRQLFSFAVVGISLNVTGYLLYLVLAEIFWSKIDSRYPLSSSSGISYFANRRFTFQDFNGLAFQRIVAF